MVAQDRRDKLRSMPDDHKDPLDLDEVPEPADDEPAEPEPAASPLSALEPEPDEPTDLGPDDDQADDAGSDLDLDPEVAENEEAQHEGPEPAGWIDDEDTSDAPAPEPANPPEGDEQAPTEWADLDDAPPPDDEQWAALEDERQMLPPGRVLVGWREFVSLPQLGLHDVIACFDTGTASSTVSGTVVGIQGGRVRLALGGVEGEVPGTVTSDGVFVRLSTLLAGVSRTIRLQVVESIAPHAIVLGRDAMEGYVVVDVALSFLHRRVGSANPGS
jgi:hypothetical protein